MIFLPQTKKHNTMQLFSNKGRPALALALKLVASSSLAYAQDSENCQGPISYLSASPNINVQYSWATNCDKSNSCLSANLVPGACCMPNVQSQYVMLAIAKSLSYR
jgi:hypothetical protein